MVNEAHNLNEIELKVYKMLVERFGEPIGKTIATVGIADEGPGGKKTVKDDSLERDWSDPNVVREGEGCSCGKTEVDEVETPSPKDHKIPLSEKTPPGGEKVVKALKKNKDVKNPWATAWSMKKKGYKFKK